MHKSIRIGIVAMFVAALIGGGFLLFGTSSSLAQFTSDLFSFDVAGGAREVPDGWREYASKEFGFSLLYPEGMTVREETNAPRSRTILFEDTENALTFQLFFGPYHEPKITEERFRKDIPSGIVRNPETISIDGGEATFFYSKDLSLGEMAEVWFLRDRYIYEFTAPAQLAPWLREVATTWQRI